MSRAAYVVLLTWANAVIETGQVDDSSQQMRHTALLTRLRVWLACEELAFSRRESDEHRYLGENISANVV